MTQQRHRTGFHPCRQRGAKSGVTEAACAAIDVRDSWEAARRLWWWALGHACEKHAGVLQCDEAGADSERVSEALRLRVISRLSSASQVPGGCSTRIIVPSASLQLPTLPSRLRAVDHNAAPVGHTCAHSSSRHSQGAVACDRGILQEEAAHFIREHQNPQDCGAARRADSNRAKLRRHAAERKSVLVQR